MIHPIETVQIIASDLPAYVDQCKDQGVTPLISRPNGWTEMTSATLGDTFVGMTLIDPMYGSEDIDIKPSLVVNVAIYGNVSVA